MTTLAMLSRSGDYRKDIVHLIDKDGAMSLCGSFSAWGTSVYSHRTEPLDFVDLERADVNGKLCGRCLSTLDIPHQAEWSEETAPSARRGHSVENMDELIELL